MKNLGRFLVTGRTVWPVFQIPFKMKNKQRELREISISSNEILSGGLKRAKNASKLCTVSGFRRSENILVDFLVRFWILYKMKK